MRILLAADGYAPAHSGSGGIAWWLANGLRARGHDVGVVTPEPPRYPPDPEATALAGRRLRGGPALAPVVQRQLLDLTDASTDPAGADLSGVDGVIAVGSAAPHVRRVVQRAAGWVPTVTHLHPGDLDLLRVPVIRHELRAHSLVTHWASLAAIAGAALRRPVGVAHAGPHPPVGGDTEPPGLKGRKAGADGDHRRTPIALWIRTRSGPLPRALERWQRDTEATCAVSGMTEDLPPTPAFTPLPSVERTRLDEFLGRADFIICEPGDLGDLPVTALGAGRPLIAYRGSSAVEEVAASGGGWVIESEPSLAAALAAVGGEGASRGQAGATYVARCQNWDHTIPVYERFLAG